MEMGAKLAKAGNVLERLDSSIADLEEELAAAKEMKEILMKNPDLKRLAELTSKFRNCPMPF